ncbi:MAG: alpha/beta fold hydrolase [Chitinophagales bacterium]|nr:alpha/beta fold hydrolase [Chitinophagales bacterium]MDW8419168.1 alpha/beta fold hydrolase [Chitinophagales bacterium]
MQLNFKSFGTGEPLIILHGLFGSLDNWQTIARRMAEQAVQQYHRALAVYILDLRNHGRSPHSDEFTYPVMANDVREFAILQGLTKISLLGHSMGGKVAMQYAQMYPETLHKLIISDITPAAYNDRHADVFDAIAYALQQPVASRSEIAGRLRQKLSDEATVQFLLKNAERTPEGFRWRFNAHALKENYAHISGAIETVRTVNLPALFIKGESSDYINRENYPALAAMFPHHELTEIKNSGHWVHADQPDAFIEETLKFLFNSNTAG